MKTLLLKMKTLLLKTAGKQTLHHNVLVTLLYEADDILNSRPLTPLDVQDPDGPTALTPSHFITSQVASFIPTSPRKTIYTYGKRWRYL